MKAGPAIIVGAVIFAVVGGIISVVANPPTADNDAKPNRQIASAPPELRRWRSHFDGVEVACFQSGGSRGFVTLPTNEQMADGTVVMRNADPSDDAWNMACSH